MTVAANAPDLSSRPFNLSVERLMTASPEVLYKAWTKQFDRWFAAPGTLIMEGLVNTPFFFETRHEGQRYPHYGRFLNLEQDRLVEMTWVTGKGGTQGAETVVRAQFETQGSGTLLRLFHAGFPEEESRYQHEQAWPMVLAQLDKVLTGE